MYGRQVRLHTGICWGKREGKKPIRRPRRRWEDNRRMDPQKVGWGGMHRIELAQDRDRSWANVEAAMCIRMA
jgi:hypothetical protein